MAIKDHISGDGRFRTLALTVDTEADIGLQVIVAQAAGYSWKQICALFGKSKSALDEQAAKARARLVKR